MASGIQNRVRELRAVTFRGEVSQKELAERAGIDPSTLSDIENQKAQPSVETALSLARALGISVEDLFLPPDVTIAGTETSAPAPENGSATVSASSSRVVAQEPPADRSAAEIPAGDGEAEAVG